MWDTTSIKIKHKLRKNYVVLVYDEKVPRHFWRISTVTGVLPSRESETKRSDNENEKGQWNPQMSRKKLFVTEYTYHDTKQTDKARDKS